MADNAHEIAPLRCTLPIWVDLATDLWTRPSPAILNYVLARSGMIVYGNPGRNGKLALRVVMVDNELDVVLW